MNKRYTSRHPHEDIFDSTKFDTLQDDEWDDDSIGRLDEPGWDKRYEYEAKLIDDILNNRYEGLETVKISKVLELGSGPGTLSQKILKNNPELTYHLVDKENAKKYFDENNFKGKMFVKDLSSGFDTTGLLDSYDLIITNDFLEHVLNPSAIASSVHSITHKDSLWMVSNPNWRMGHQYVYRGLFDFDNIVYFLHVHGFSAMTVFGSPLKTPQSPRLSSELQLPEHLLDSWNHYILLKHRELKRK